MQKQSAVLFEKFENEFAFRHLEQFIEELPKALQEEAANTHSEYVEGTPLENRLESLTFEDFERKEVRPFSDQLYVAYEVIKPQLIITICGIYSRENVEFEETQVQFIFEQGENEKTVDYILSPTGRLERFMA